MFENPMSYPVTEELPYRTIETPVKERSTPSYPFLPFVLEDYFWVETYCPLTSVRLPFYTCPALNLLSSSG